MPRTQIYGQALRTDENGFIYTGRDMSPDASRILVLGDSVVETMFVEENLRMCARLEEMIAARSPVSVRVLNGGMTGSTTLHLLNLFLNKGLPLAPALVVLMSGVMDLDASLNQAGFWTGEPRIAPIVTVPEEASPGSDPILLDADFSGRGRLLRSFAAIAMLHDVPLMMATVPHRTSYEDSYVKRRYPSPTPFMRAVELRKRMNACTRDACAAMAVPLIDLEQRLENRPELFYDEFHLNEVGSSVVAEEIHAELGRDLTRIVGRKLHPEAEKPN